MTPQPLAAQPSGLSLGDIYYVIFRHKWKLLTCIAISVGAALTVQRLVTTPFQSEAKLFVRYVIADKSINPAASDAAAKSPDQRGETIMNSETEILTSSDLSRAVAEAIGPEKILAKLGGGNDLITAAAVVHSGLSVSAAQNSSVIHLSFKHPDAEIVQPVLREIAERYLKLHLETHTSAGILGDALSQETDQLRARLATTEDELRKALGKAGVVSIEDARQTYSTQSLSIRRELYEAEAELAQRTAAFEELNKRMPATSSAPTDAEAPIPLEILEEYRSATNQWDLLKKMEQELLTQFTPQNSRVAEVHAQLTEAEDRRKALQAKYPRLIQITPTETHGPLPDALNGVALSTQIMALKAKVNVYNSQLNALRSDAARLDQMEGIITELRRKKELEEASYRTYAASLEQARINETLGNGRVSNIVQIQKPSPPFSDNSKAKKLVGLVLCGGLIAGFAWVFALEFYFDNTLKRPIDVERAIPAPLLLSIPALRPKQLEAATVAAIGDGNRAGTAQPALAVYHETLRDRLIGYFESVNLNHKPKLVAVTGLSRGAGITTTATGLARSLSETGEGNVLLVDMNVNQGAAQQFTQGKAICGIDQLLEARENAAIEENLFIVTENPQSERLSRNMPQRFTKLVPQLKASDFDYIIFDMPPVSQISITPRLAGFMDMVLLVVESEKTDRDLVQRATELLAQTRAHVGVVLNKTRNYVPLRLHQATLSS